jgi:hypothetical protein
MLDDFGKLNHRQFVNIPPFLRSISRRFCSRCDAIMASKQVTSFFNNETGSMKQAIDHPWPVDEAGATALQYVLAELVEQTDRLGNVNTVAGVDVAYDTHSARLVAAVLCPMRACWRCCPALARTVEVLSCASAHDVERFPYLPGLFSFRELPAIAAALQQLAEQRGAGHASMMLRSFGLQFDAHSWCASSIRTPFACHLSSSAHGAMRCAFPPYRPGSHRRKPFATASDAGTMRVKVRYAAALSAPYPNGSSMLCAGCVNHLGPASVM